MMENTVVTTDNRQLSPEELKSRRTLTLIIYVLQGLAFLIGITSVVAVIMNYVKRDDMRGTWLASHFRWQIRTFWYALLWMCVGIVFTWAAGIGAVVLLANVIWVIYRIVRGVLNLLDNKPMYQ